MTNNKPCYALSGIPANKKGERFIAQLREYANRAIIARIRVRANGARKHLQRDTRREDAESFRVYLDRSDAREAWLRTYQAEALATARLALVKRLTADNEAYRGTIRSYEEHLSGHAANVRRLEEEKRRLLDMGETQAATITSLSERAQRAEARVAQCPPSLWTVIDFFRSQR